MATADWRSVPSSHPGITASPEIAWYGRAGSHSITSLAVAYVLLVPLLLFSVHGGFSFEHASWNSDLGAVGGKMAVVSTSDESLQERVQSWTASAICLGAMLPYFRLVAGVCQRMPLLFVLPLYAIASAFWSQDPMMSLRSGIYLMVNTLFAFYLVARFSHRQQMELIVWTGACVVLLNIAFALLWPQFGLDHQLHEGAWQGLFTQKNVCAESTLFLLTPALALDPRGRYGQILRAVYVFLCLLVIFMTQSRTGWAMTAAYLAFASCLGLLGRFPRKDLLPLAGLLLAAIMGIALVLLGHVSMILSIASRSDTLSGRAQIWNAVIAAILRRPTGGYGFDAFWSLLHGEASRVFASTGWVVTSAHNGFLNLGLELGIVGFVLVMVTFIRALRDASAAFHPARSAYVDWCIGIVFLTLIYNVDERTLMATQYLPWILYIVACAGLAEAARSNARTHREVPSLKGLP